MASPQGQGCVGIVNFRCSTACSAHNPKAPNHSPPYLEEHGFGYIQRSLYTPYSIYLRGAVSLVPQRAIGCWILLWLWTTPIHLLVAPPLAIVPHDLPGMVWERGWGMNARNLRGCHGKWVLQNQKCQQSQGLCVRNAPSS